MKSLILAVYDEKSLRKKIRFRQSFQYEHDIPRPAPDTKSRSETKDLAKAN